MDRCARARNLRAWRVFGPTSELFRTMRTRLGATLGRAYRRDAGLVSRQEQRLVRLFARVLPIGLALPVTVAACASSRAPTSDAGAPADPCKPKLTSVF